MHKHYPSQVRGFTIVEMIVMVTIIAVLAAITIFAFGAWRSRTATAEVTTALTHLASALKSEQTFNNVYPSSVPSSYQASTGVTITYTNTSTTYCAKGTSTAVSTVVLYISNTNPVPSGTACM